MSLPTRHRDLWFEDGDVVVKADALLFRLHRGVLSMHCEHFRSVLSVSSPLKLEQYDDLALIVLQEAQAMDAVHFLKAMYLSAYLIAYFGRI